MPVDQESEQPTPSPRSGIGRFIEGGGIMVTVIIAVLLAGAYVMSSNQAQSKADAERLRQVEPDREQSSRWSPPHQSATGISQITSSRESEKQWQWRGLQPGVDLKSITVVNRSGESISLPQAWDEHQYDIILLFIASATHPRTRLQLGQLREQLTNRPAHQRMAIVVVYTREAFPASDQPNESSRYARRARELNENEGIKLTPSEDLSDRLARGEELISSLNVPTILLADTMSDRVYHAFGGSGSTALVSPRGELLGRYRRVPLHDVLELIPSLSHSPPPAGRE